MVSLVELCKFFSAFEEQMRRSLYCKVNETLPLYHKEGCEYSSASRFSRYKLLALKLNCQKANTSVNSPSLF